MKDTQTLSRQRISLSRQKKLEVEVNVVVTKMTIIAIEVEKNDKKICAAQKQMLQHNKELKAYISVATIKAVESEISITIENGRKVR